MPTTMSKSDDSQTADVAALVERAADGDEDAFALLVRTHHRKVRAYLAGLVHSVHDADDLAQEVFITAYRNLTAFERRSSFGAWLLGIARHRAMHHLRTEVRRRKREGDPVRVALAQSRYEQAENADDEKLESKALRQCLDGLPRHSRGLVSAFYFGKRKADDIAREQNTKASTIRMTLFRIRRVLADCIKRRIADEELPT